MKQNILPSTILIIIFITAAAIANSTPTPKRPSPVKKHISLKITPAPLGTWYFSSKQYIDISISGLPSGKYNIVLFLKNLKSGKKGKIAMTPVSNGKEHVQFVVNEIEYDDGTYALTNGKYEFSLAIFKEPGENQKYSGDLIIEKNVRIIEIKGSDVPAGQQRKYDSSDG
jgi:hypothetical protein